MAGEWIKVELATCDKPEVLRLARILGIEKDAVFGKLIRLWAWFDRNSVDGVVDGVVDADVDQLCYQVGFCSALVQVGWLKVDPEAMTVTIPRFSRHNGESAKKRALKSERQSRWRSKVDGEVDVKASTEASTPASTREEKRRIKEQGAPDGGPVWTECLQILEAQNLGEKQARAFLGMLCRDYEEPQIVEAVKAAVGKANVTAYVRGVLKSAPKKGQSGLRLAI